MTFGLKNAFKSLRSAITRRIVKRSSAAFSGEAMLTGIAAPPNKTTFSAVSLAGPHDVVEFVADGFAALKASR
ncbi:MAG: hypothetical protein EXQ90_07150 [Rhodospirillales bacterium]|nr:hypothetical protein [Rhodospirillales bacterium]